MLEGDYIIVCLGCVCCFVLVRRNVAGAFGVRAWGRGFAAVQGFVLCLFGLACGAKLISAMAVCWIADNEL